jgi:hypothetical protein
MNMKAWILLMAILGLSAPASAQLVSEELCIACTADCPETNLSCGEVGIQWCGLWQDGYWLTSTLHARLCSECPEGDEECVSYGIEPTTAPDYFEHTCTPCEDNERWCGLADLQAQKWVDDTVKHLTCEIEPA